MIQPALLSLVLSLSGAIVGAQEFVTAGSPLPDADFYRLVACAAPPGGACQKPFVRWSVRDARDISVRVVQVDEAFPQKRRSKVEAMLDPTLDRLNEVGANFRVSHAPAGPTPDIRIFLLDRPRFSTVEGTGLPWFDGQPLDAARMQMGWRSDGTAIECAIAFSRDVQVYMVQRVLIEEIVQCLGLMTDIGGTYYESRSIFSERGETQTLGTQDIMALRRHYP